MLLKALTALDFPENGVEILRIQRKFLNHISGTLF
jgi:hypothetical protein